MAFYALFEQNGPTTDAAKVRLVSAQDWEDITSLYKRPEGSKEAKK